jgi:cytoskeletal protein CcmA (bactofilin family)
MFNNKPSSRPDSTPHPEPSSSLAAQPQPTSDDQASRRPTKTASLIAAGTTLEGNIGSDGELQVEGVIRGDIKVGRLTVGTAGQVEGSITAEIVECRGRVIGSITAKQVRLYASAHVDGDITHEQLAMESGAFFQGRSLRFKRTSKSEAAEAPAPVEPLGLPAPSEP